MIVCEKLNCNSKVKTRDLNSSNGYFWLIELTNWRFKPLTSVRAAEIIEAGVKNDRHFNKFRNRLQRD